MADNNETFVDPLDEIVKKHQAAAGIEPTKPEPKVEEVHEEPIETPKVNYIRGDMEIDDDDEFGDHDFEREMEQEELEAQRRREEAIRIAQENKKPEVQMPPNSLDKGFQQEAVDFQTNVLAIVTTMVNKVVAKHHLTQGGIPDDKRMSVMGELVELYHENGDVITEEFENVILENWEGAIPDEPTIQQTTNNATPTQNEPVEEIKTTTINIDVQPDTPVTVNVDDSITHVLGSGNVVNVRVREVTEDEMRKATVIENSPMDGIITTFDSGMNDTPVTLPMSGYRTTMRPVNWFESLQMAAPTSRSQVREPSMAMVSIGVL